MPNKRKYISTEYGMVNLRDGDWVIHLDPEALAELYWEVQDEKLVRVVRCKDCKYYSVTTLGMPYACWHGASEVWGQTGEHAHDVVAHRIDSPDFYCAWGERDG